MDDPPTDATYRDAGARTDRRVEDLLDRMTLAEKAAQLGSVRADQLVDGGELDREAAEALLSDGVGHLTRIGGEGGLEPGDAARVTAEIQSLLRSETRLGVPAIPHEECLSGYMGPAGTTVPQGIGLASTWDPALVASVTDAIRAELRAIGTCHALSPVADVARDPRWGRTEETFGEDPYLVAAMVCAYVSGLQGDESDSDGADATSEPSPGVSATVKHFLGHGAGAGGKNRSAVDLAPRTLREVHGFPFEAAVRVADVDAVMNAYHAIDGVPCAAAEWLLTDLLRGEWGFDGTVVSDYYSVDFLQAEHGVAGSDREAAVAALRAGIDVELPATDCYATLADAVRAGDLAEATLDRAVRRVLRAKVRAGLLDESAGSAPDLDEQLADPDEAASAAEAAFDTEEATAIARRAARESFVLLENEDLLPLGGADLSPLGGADSSADRAGTDADRPKTDAAAAGPDSVAVVGPKADSRTGLLGDYAYAAHYPEEEYEFEATTPLDAIESRVDADVAFARGCTTTGPSTDGFGEAAAVAADADVALAFVGARSAVDFSDPDGDVASQPTVSTSGEGRDVTDLSLPGVQADLIERVAETDTPLVVVVVSGTPHSITGAAECADAVVQAWLPGEEGGDALVDVLFAGRDPGGRLPISIPRSVGQLPVHYARRPNTAGERYVYDDGAPLYGFGHGESYAEFEYGDLELSPGNVESSGDADPSTADVESSGDAQPAGELEPAGTVTATVEVTNVADRPGSEVVQCYASAESPSLTRPVQELVGFQRLSLAAGETARVAFELSASQLAFHDREDRLRVEAGPYELRVGRAADAIETRERIEVTETATVPRGGRTFFADVTVG